jgi:small subunit ribosomal protein S5e
VLVDAIVNTGPREDSTRIGSQGTVRRQAVDVSPLRRVNQAVALLTVGVRIIFLLKLLCEVINHPIMTDP